MKPLHFFLIIAELAASVPSTGASQTRALLPDGVSVRDIRFYSEGVECYGRLFTPKGFSASSKSPAVVLAPGWRETASSVERFAARFAERGLVAMAIDYRGWGKSGGFVQTVDPVKTDDRLRFSEMTARVRIRRRRLIPQHQILDVRNALYFLQGEPGVDRDRVGVWGTGMSGGHTIVIAATDARVKAIVAQTPIIEGNDTPQTASAPSGELLQAELRRARTGRAQVPKARVTGREDLETQLALGEYHPFWYVDQIPQSIPVLFILAEKDTRANLSTSGIALSKLKGSTSNVRIAGVSPAQIRSGAAFDTAANAAADWFLKHL